MCSRTARLIVVPECCREREVYVGIFAHILSAWHPDTVWCLMVNHETERLVFVSLVKIFNGMVGDEVGYISHLLFIIAIMSCSRRLGCNIVLGR